MFIYSKDKRINQILNTLTQQSAQEQFKNADGVFSMPNGGHSLDNPGLSEDELSIITDYEEEQ